MQRQRHAALRASCRVAVQRTHVCACVCVSVTVCVCVTVRVLMCDCVCVQARSQSSSLPVGVAHSHPPPAGSVLPSALCPSLPEQGCVDPPLPNLWKTVKRTDRLVDQKAYGDLTTSLPEQGKQRQQARPTDKPTKRPEHLLPPDHILQSHITCQSLFKCLRKPPTSPGPLSGTFLLHTRTPPRHTYIYTPSR